MTGSRGDREGMALLTVLLMVAVMAAIAVLVLDDVRFSVRRATNAATMSQAQWYALGAEALARRQIGRLNRADPIRTPLTPDWNGRPLAFPIEEGELRAVVTDGQACFNLNSVVQGAGEALTARPRGALQLIALGRAVGVDEGRMRGIADALTDWIDSDQSPLPRGGEDGTYAGRAAPYRTAGTLVAEVSELRAVKGVDADAYRRLRPYLCALPYSELSPINPNTLRPEQAPLLVMLSEGSLSAQSARSAIAARPAAGWTDVGAFWNQPAMSSVEPASDVYDQISLRTRFFALRVDVDYGGARAVRTTLLQITSDGSVRPVISRWTPDE